MVFGLFNGQGAAPLRAAPSWGPNSISSSVSFRAPSGILRLPSYSDGVGGTWSCKFNAADPGEDGLAEAGGVAPGRPTVPAVCGEPVVFTCKGDFVDTKSDGAAICKDCVAQFHVFETAPDIWKIRVSSAYKAA